MAESLTLHLPDFVRVAGETLQGHVDVNIPMAMNDKIENVRVKVRGYIVTKYTEREHETGPEGPRNETHRKTLSVEVVRLDQTIWDHFNAQDGGPEVVQCPFQMPLPPTLPPSFHHSTLSHSVTISYSLEVVGSRHGMFHANRRVRRIFSVVPPANAGELNATASLKQGWAGQWKPIATTKLIRHGVLFGDHSEAKIELVLPDLPSLPMGTGIPFAFHVWTKTKPVHQEDLDKHEKLFPAPPASPADVQLAVHRQGSMRVRHKSEPMDDKFDLSGSLGDKDAADAVRMTVDQPEFTPAPDHKDKGFWKRGVHFEGMLVIPHAPTFSVEAVEWHYLLRVKVDFPGIGNDLELEFPVHIHSGVACPPLPQAGYQMNVPYAYPLPSGPPPMMNLPPSYWNGEHHNWDEES